MERPLPHGSPRPASRAGPLMCNCRPPRSGGRGSGDPAGARCAGTSGHRWAATPRLPPTFPAPGVRGVYEASGGRSRLSKQPAASPRADKGRAPPDSGRGVGAWGSHVPPGAQRGHRALGPTCQHSPGHPLTWGWWRLRPRPGLHGPRGPAEGKVGSEAAPQRDRPGAAATERPGGWGGSRHPGRENRSRCPTALTWVSPRLCLSSTMRVIYVHFIPVLDDFPCYNGIVFLFRTPRGGTEGPWFTGSPGDSRLKNRKPDRDG